MDISKVIFTIVVSILGILFLKPLIDMNVLNSWSKYVVYVILIVMVLCSVLFSPILQFINTGVTDIGTSMESATTETAGIIHDNWVNAMSKKYSYFIWSAIIIFTIIALSMLYFLFYDTIITVINGIPMTSFTYSAFTFLFKIVPVILIFFFTALFVITFYIQPLTDNSYTILSAGWFIVYWIGLIYTIYKVETATQGSWLYMQSPKIWWFRGIAAFITGILLTLVIFMKQIVEWIAKTFDKKDIESPVASDGTNIYSLFTYYILVLVQGYILYNKVYHTSTLEYTIKVYGFVYIVLSIILQIINPGNFLKGMLGTPVIYSALLPLLFYILSVTNLNHQYALPLLFNHLALFASLLGLNISTFYFAFAFFNSEKTSSNYSVAFIFALLYVFAIFNFNIDLRTLFTRVKHICSYLTLPRHLLYELVFIIVFLYMRSWMKNYYLYNGELLQNTPVPLSNYKVLKTPEFEYKYAISFWLKIDSSSLSTEYVPILSYGDKPSISYHSIDNTLRVSMKTQGKQQALMTDITDVALQKWNHIVINYNNGILDVFYNGDLVRTNQVIPYHSNEKIILGSDENINGSIGNVAYFPDSITREQVVKLYDAFKHKNPPII